MEYGCIGEILKHSFSKEIHNLIAPYDYQLKEIARDELDDFMKKSQFKAINVTIPYKEKVIPYLDFVDDIAKEIGAVNTIVNRKGKLFGFNTDFYGMIGLIKRANVEIENKTVAILGSGGTSKTARAVAKFLKAKSVYVVSRKLTENDLTNSLGSAFEKTISYDGLSLVKDEIEVIINTTPVGMYPNLFNLPVDLEEFKNVKGVIDVIYNPLKTRLILQAEKLKIKCAGGLYMLVLQAVKACEIFTDGKIDQGVCEKVYDEILLSKQNVVLIGMPSSGKTTVGELLSKELNREFLDTDKLIEKSTNKTVSQIFLEKKEKGFRDIESSVIKEQVANKSGIVVATGGGAVLRSENVEALKMNGKLFFLDRSLESLTPTGDRPLSKSVDDLKKRYDERYDIYVHSADIVIKNPLSKEQAKERIMQELNK